MNNKIKVSVAEALKLIKEGKSLTEVDVKIDEAIDGAKAFRLRKNGVQVPHDMVSYLDEDLEYDEAFDGPWETLPDQVDETTYEGAQVTVSITSDMKKWIERNDVNLSELINDLWVSYYKLDQKIHGE